MFFFSFMGHAWHQSSTKETFAGEADEEGKNRKKKVDIDTVVDFVIQISGERKHE